MKRAVYCLACCGLISSADAETSLERVVLPIVAYDEDKGLGTGLLGAMAMLDGDPSPYRWRTEVQTYAAHRPGPDGREITYQEHYLAFDRARGWRGLRLSGLAQFGRYSTSGYYGMGAGSERDPDAPDRTYQYDHSYPGLDLTARLPVIGEWEAFGSLASRYATIDLYENSLLADDLAARAESFVGIAPHVSNTLQLGGLLDRRDDETWTTQGVRLEASLRGGWAAGTDVLRAVDGTRSDHATHWGGNLSVSAYAPLLADRLIVAARGIVDSVSGDVPLYALAEYGGSKPGSGPGGKDSVRGVADRRFHAPGKAIANVELRTRFLPGTFLGMPSALGLVAFADAGHVWGSTATASAAPGPVARGTGIGVRSYLGETVVIRVDKAWSQEGDGLYVTLGELF